MRGRFGEVNHRFADVEAIWHLVYDAQRLTSQVAVGRLGNDGMDSRRFSRDIGTLVFIGHQVFIKRKEPERGSP